MTDVIAVFAKAPQPGRVKTRLQPSLTAEEATAFYEASLKDVIDNALGAGAALQIVYDDVGEAEAYFAKEFPDLPRQPQSAGGLGERLRTWCDSAFVDGADRVLVIGADSPTLPRAFIVDARNALAEADLVFGPAEDGGYYLVGIASSAWPLAGTIFEGIAWSTSEVLRESLDHARGLGLRHRLTTTWYDVDEIGELTRAQRDAADDSRVAEWLKAHDFADRAHPPA